jgi:phosphoribosylaminoimidazolecarboxamide formyltransferase / IMP cyclohydrolase
VIAPEYSAAPSRASPPSRTCGCSRWRCGDANNDFDFKRVGGGLLVQTPDTARDRATDLKDRHQASSKRGRTADLLFAWRVAKFVKSNAIVFARDGATVGVGAGQMSRLDSARIASIKAQAAGLTLDGSAVASDAFFPFRDGLDVVVDAGARCVIQPGGSVRDAEVIAAADERELRWCSPGFGTFRH